MHEPKLQGKSHDIPKRLIWEAWLRVQENGGAAGPDGVTIEQFAGRLHDNLYKLWNRMSSGSYFPGPVRAAARWKSRKTGAESGSSEFPRRRHSAALSSDPLGFVIVTHPFHPLNGQRLEILYAKRRGADTVFVCAGGFSGQMTLPQAWTDRGEPPLGRRLSAEGLAALGAATRALQGR